jgi:hypothetical protein
MFVNCFLPFLLSFPPPIFRINNWNNTPFLTWLGWNIFIVFFYYLTNNMLIY